MGKFLSRLFNKKSNDSTTTTRTTDTASNSNSQIRNHSNQEIAISRENQNVKQAKSQKSDMSRSRLTIENNFDTFDNVLHVNYAPNSCCVFGDQHHSLQLFDFVKQKTVKEWKGHDKDITKVLYCAKLDRYLSSSRDKSIKMWSLANDKPQLNMLGHELVVTAISVDPTDNQRLISGSRDNNLNLWDLKTGTMINSSHISRNLISDVFWSNDGKILIQSGEDKETRLWDPTTLKVIHSFPKKQYIQSSCHISSNNFYAVTSSNGFQRNGCEITIWDLRKRAILSELFGHEETVTCAKFIRSDDFIASCSNDSFVRLWDAKTHKIVDILCVSNTLTSISEHPSNKRILLVSSLANGVYTLTL